MLGHFSSLFLNESSQVKLMTCIEKEISCKASKYIEFNPKSFVGKDIFKTYMQ